MPHPFTLPPEYVERAEQREGRKHSVTHLKGNATALVVVDMQRFFMEEPYAGACRVAPDIVPNVNRIARGLRTAGGTVVWLQMEAPSDPADWSALRARYSESNAHSRWESLGRANHGFELWPDLDIGDEDLRLIKNRYSAFIPGSSELDDVLRCRGVDTLLICGVATNACCESTARDAMMLNYNVMMVSDGCAAATDAEHSNALTNFYLFFGDVQTTDEVIMRLEDPHPLQRHSHSPG